MKDSIRIAITGAALPLLASVLASDDPDTAFKDADYALLAGAKPRGAGVERSDGSYGIEPGVIQSLPCTCENGVWNFVPEVGISDFSRERMRATDQELREEREAVADLL